MLGNYCCGCSKSENKEIAKSKDERTNKKTLINKNANNYNKSDDKNKTYCNSEMEWKKFNLKNDGGIETKMELIEMQTRSNGRAKNVPVAKKESLSTPTLIMPTQEKSPFKSIMKRKSLSETVTKQPKLCSQFKRHSVHGLTTETNEKHLHDECKHEHEDQQEQKQEQEQEHDDDDVFEEGITATVTLAKNLGTSLLPRANDQNVRNPLPRWFSEEEEDMTNEEEIGGVCEPPATPIGKDELALKRHRFFSELLKAARQAEEHRVRFDPLGPVIAGADDSKFCHQYQFNSELEALINRLENATVKLENIYLPLQKLTKENFSQTIKVEDLSISCEKLSASSPNIKELENCNMSVVGFDNIIGGPLARYLNISHQIGGDVAEQSKYVKNAFEAQLQYLILATQSKKPAQADQLALLQPTSQQISNIQDYREKHRTSPFFNHLSAISESIPALGWVTISPAPAPYIKEMNDAGQFYTNRVLKDWKEKDKRHVDWVKAWLQTLTELQSFVKQFHTTGLVWSGKGAAPAAGAIPPPPPPGCPPPPTFEDFSTCEDIGVDRSALFDQINQGENITRSLKKVTSEMQTHKNPTLREGPVPFKAPTNVCSINSKLAPIEKSPIFARDGKKWLIEYQKNNNNLVVDNVEMNNVVYLFKCENSTVTVKGKLNSITLDSCKKTSIVFDTLVSSMEFINCQSVQMQVFGKVRTISIDKTDGCQMYLSNDSLDVEIISSKSSEMNVLVPKGNGDYTEYPLPEQYKTTITPSRGLYTVIIENKG